MIKKGYICLNDRELKSLKRECVFVLLTEKQAKDYKRFYEKNYNVHHNILKVKMELSHLPNSALQSDKSED